MSRKLILRNGLFLISVCLLYSVFSGCGVKTPILLTDPVFQYAVGDIPSSLKVINLPLPATQEELLNSLDKTVSKRRGRPVILSPLFSSATPKLTDSYPETVVFSFFPASAGDSNHIPLITDRKEAITKTSEYLVEFAAEKGLLKIGVFFFTGTEDRRSDYKLLIEALEDCPEIRVVHDTALPSVRDRNRLKNQARALSVDYPDLAVIFAGPETTYFLETLEGTFPVITENIHPTFTARNRVLFSLQYDYRKVLETISVLTKPYPQELIVPVNIYCPEYIGRDDFIKISYIFGENMVISGARK